MELHERMNGKKTSQLVRNYGFFLMISMFASALYNFVDSIFVSYISEEALSAVSLVSPIQMIMSALGCGVAIGLNAIISKALGERKHDYVKKVLNSSLLLAFMCYVIVLLAGIFLSDIFIRWQADGHMQIYQYGSVYLKICMIFSFGMYGQWVFDRCLIVTGKNHLFLLTLGFASLMNIILDPIFIFGYFGLPPMHTQGAAIATVIGQISGACLGFYVNKKYNKDIPIELKIKPSYQACFQILKVGIPTAFMQSIVGLSGMIMNSILLSFSSGAVALLGIINKVQSIVNIPCHGFGSGLVAIVAFYYGTKDFQKMKQAIYWGLFYSFILTGMCTLLIIIFPQNILNLFDISAYLQNSAIVALRIMALTFLVSVLNFILSYVFQALSQSYYSLLTTVLRQACLPLVFSMIAVYFDKLELIWVSYLLAEVIVIPVGCYFIHKVSRYLKSYLLV